MDTSNVLYNLLRLFFVIGMLAFGIMEIIILCKPRFPSKEWQRTLQHRNSKRS